MSPFVIVSRKYVLNNEKSQKNIDFVDDSGYFTAFRVISRHKRVKMPNNKRNSSFSKIK